MYWGVIKINIRLTNFTFITPAFNNGALCWCSTTKGTTWLRRESGLQSVSQPVSRYRTWFLACGALSHITTIFQSSPLWQQGSGAARLWLISSLVRRCTEIGMVQEEAVCATLDEIERNTPNGSHILPQRTKAQSVDICTKVQHVYVRVPTYTI